MNKDMQKEKKEYLVKYRIGTWWTAEQTTEWNTYQEFVKASSAKEAVKKEFGVYNFSNPNKSIELLSVTLIG
jgi:hypothetical protein